MDAVATRPPWNGPVGHPGQHMAHELHSSERILSRRRPDPGDVDAGLSRLDRLSVYLWHFSVMPPLKVIARREYTLRVSWHALTGRRPRFAAFQGEVVIIFCTRRMFTYAPGLWLRSALRMQALCRPYSMSLCTHDVGWLSQYVPATSLGLQYFPPRCLAPLGGND